MAAGVILLKLLDVLVLGDEAFAKSNIFCKGLKPKTGWSAGAFRSRNASLAKAWQRCCRIVVE